MSVRPKDYLTQGHEALSRGAWREARAVFEAALAAEESPEALEGLGTAAWWLSDGPTVFDARSRAYKLYHERGDRRAAGHPRAALEAAAFALEQDDHEEVLRLAQRFLRQAPEAQRPERIAALDLILRAELARRNMGASRKALERIQAIVATTSSAPLAAAARAAAAAIIR
jgi:hypothetical protein